MSWKKKFYAEMINIEERESKQIDLESHHAIKIMSKEDLCEEDAEKILLFSQADLLFFSKTLILLVFFCPKLQGCYFETISKYSCECFKTFQKEIDVKIVSLKTKNEVVAYLNYIESRSKEIFAEKRFGKKAKFMTKDEVKVELKEGEWPKSIFLKIKDGAVERSEVALSANDDKRVILPDRVNTHAIGY